MGGSGSRRYGGRPLLFAALTGRSGHGLARMERIRSPIRSASSVTLVSDAVGRHGRPDADSGAIVPIEQHSLLSDQRIAAIVTPDARVVWLCSPRIDSHPLLAELLGGPAAGFFSVRPLEAGGGPAQRYVGDSMALETSWEDVAVLDYLDCSEGLPTEPAGRSRLVRVLTGTGKALAEFAPFPGSGGKRLECRDGGIGVRDGDAHSARLRSPGLDWHIESHGQEDVARAEVDLSTGPVVLELLCGAGSGDCASAEPERRSATIEHWRGWVDRLILPPLQTDLVRRSALVLKALCHGPTGAIIAAPTTSLPQELRGSRNWDYRYCWMRDGSMAAATLVRLGSIDEAMGLLDWLLRLIGSGGAELDHLAPIYTVEGEALPPERSDPDLPGYAGSQPVRIGNAAEQQVQTDVFGPIMELIWRLGRAGAPLDERHWRLVELLVDAVGRRWQEPDQGIWEIRAAPRHHVHSKTMCWMAVDRGTSLAGTLFDHSVPEWERLRDIISAEVLTEGWNTDERAFTAAYGSRDLDSAVLAVGLSGLVPPDDSRWVATVEAIEARLRHGPTVYRYRRDDGLPGEPSGFNLMTSWLIDAKILVGDLDGAQALFDDYIALAGPTGLLSEEHDPVTAQARGNFPQAYSHLGLIENALNLAEASGL